MHPASTVRQATSKIVKFLGKYRADLLIERRISFCWLSCLLTVAKDASNASTLLSTLSSLNHLWLVDRESLSASYLPENYNQLPQTMQVYSSCYKILNKSITSMTHENGIISSPFYSTKLLLFIYFNIWWWFLLVSTTWEWREGRLLAFELIFQFLIRNHWMHAFGTSSAAKHEHLGPIVDNKLELTILLCTYYCMIR